jgi:hypothetical protein
MYLFWDFLVYLAGGILVFISGGIVFYLGFSHGCKHHACRRDDQLATRRVNRV